jgi:agmatinase
LFCVGGEHSLSHATIPPFLRRYPALGVLHFDAHADMRPTYQGSVYSHACAMYPIAKKCRVVQVGIRSIGEDEAHLVDRGNVRTFLWHEHRDMRQLIPLVLRSLPSSVYMSIDLDGFDPGVMPGVGTPQPGGYLWHEALELFRAVIKKKRVVGVDVMELCPLRDTVASELAAAKLVYRLMGYLSSRA